VGNWGVGEQIWVTGLKSFKPNLKVNNFFLQEISLFVHE
jgi:hypothetical protein